MFDGYIIVVIELPFEEVFYLDIGRLKLLSDPKAKEYFQIISESLNDEESDIMSISSDVALSSGGFNRLQTALVQPPCLIQNHIVVEIEDTVADIE